MGQLWCEHITERKSSEKKSMAMAEELFESMVMCPLPRAAMELLWNRAVLSMNCLETDGLR